LSSLDVLTLAEAASYLRLPEDAVRAEAEAGRLVGQNVRGEWRFVRAGVAAWLQTPLRPKTVSTRPRVEETQEEYDAFMAVIRAQRDEVNRATKSGTYAEE
jgi:excisionase family DNA binding protein